MKVGYTQVGEGSFPWLPLLRIDFHGPKGHSGIRALVDSGSMETMIPESVLRRIGVPATAEEVELTGMAGQKAFGHVAQVEAQFDETPFMSRVVVVPDDVVAIPILGHRDFFLKFWVAFDAPNRVFFIAPGRRH
jgi:hypothetical protein